MVSGRSACFLVFFGLFRVLRKYGFSGYQGLGGCLDFEVLEGLDGFLQVHRVLVLGFFGV